jgi:hypothetical protein
LTKKEKKSSLAECPLNDEKNMWLCGNMAFFAFQKTHDQSARDQRPWHPFDIHFYQNGMHLHETNASIL